MLDQTVIISFDGYPFARDLLPDVVEGNFTAGCTDSAPVLLSSLTDSSLKLPIR